MQENAKVSIIVPVYKVERYLKRCLDSIAAQTYRNIEVFLVDDGSPDTCGEICESYAEKDPIFRVIHQENRGQAAARNHAAKQASGDFILFIDSDDFVTPDHVEYLLYLQEEYRADVTIGGFKYLYEGDTMPPQREETQVLSLDNIEALQRMNYTKGFGAFPWAKLYKRQLILDHPFPEGQIYEDLATLYKIVGDCEKVVYGNRVIYYWLQREGSTMRSAFDERQMAAMDAVDAQIIYMEKHYPMVLPAAKYRHTAKAVELIAVCFHSGGEKSVFQQLKNCMNKYAQETLKDPHAKKTMKLRIIAVKMGYLPAKWAFRVHESAKKRYL